VALGPNGLIEGMAPRHRVFRPLQDRVGPRPWACAEPLKSVVRDGQVWIEALQLSDHRFPQWFSVRRQYPFIGPKSLCFIKVADSVEECGSEIIMSLVSCHLCRVLLSRPCLSVSCGDTSQAFLQSLGSPAAVGQGVCAASNARTALPHHSCCDPSFLIFQANLGDIARPLC
jgi:hypothetical protein